MAEYSILVSLFKYCLVESLPTELNCKVQKINVSSAPRWADCVMGEIWSFRCRNTTALAKKWNSAGQKKYRLSRFEKYNFRFCGNAKQGSVGRSAVEICHRVTTTNGDNFLFVSSLINVATFLSPFLRRGATIFYLQLLIHFILRNLNIFNSKDRLYLMINLRSELLTKSWLIQHTCLYLQSLFFSQKNFLAKKIGLGTKTKKESWTTRPALIQI